MKIRISRNKNELFKFLSLNKGLNLYLIGDLDPFYWPHTQWFVAEENGAIMSAALLYTGMSPATFLLFHDGDITIPATLINTILPDLPESFNAHLSPGLTGFFGEENILKKYGRNHRMILKKAPEPVHDENIKRIEPRDAEKVKEFYAMAYPANWFDPRMLETGKYFGYIAGGKIAGIAGVHVYSPGYRIAALGNIATLPEFRGRKIAFKLTSQLCRDLSSETDTIGLNVSSENHAAIKCYKNCGFEIASDYDECFIKNRLF